MPATSSTPTSAPAASIAGARNGTFEGMYYEVAGAGRPIIAIHGFGESLFAWRQLVPRLAATHQVHCLDLLGHGRADMTPGIAYDPQSHADRIAAYIAACGLARPLVMGHSMGGGIALMLAGDLCADAPHNIAGLILLDAMFYTMRVPLFVQSLRVPVLGQMLLDATPPRLGSRIILRKALYDHRRITPEMIEAYAQPLQTAAGRRALVRTAQDVVQPATPALAAKVAGIDVPTLIIWGEQDRIVPPAIGRTINDTIKGSILRTIPACGHCPNEEQPTATLGLIELFLAANPQVA
jgi:pimeloyl-ACP methyl ester carboxylesterase